MGDWKMKRVMASADNRTCEQLTKVSKIILDSIYENIDEGIQPDLENDFIEKMRQIRSDLEDCYNMLLHEFNNF